MKTHIQFSGLGRYVGIRFRIISFKVKGNTSTMGDHEKRRI
jgi:hypothetical protein